MAMGFLSTLVLVLLSSGWAFTAPISISKPATSVVLGRRGDTTPGLSPIICSNDARVGDKSILTLTSSASAGDAGSSEVSSAAVDVRDIVKYVAATGIQFGVLAGALKAIDKFVFLPKPAVGALFAFLSLRSRVASVLDNSRPNREAMDGQATPSEIRRPSWTPPGIAFPFIWLTITGLRGVSSAMVYGQTDALCSAPLLAMVLHLCIGDTWNTITNVEKRLGVSAVGCAAVWASAWNAIAAYYRALPLAGQVLAPSGLWISVATVLTFAIWRINTPVQPAWPAKGDGKSAAFRWSNLGQLQPTSIGGRAEAAATAPTAAAPVETNDAEYQI